MALEMYFGGERRNFVPTDKIIPVKMAPSAISNLTRRGLKRDCAQANRPRERQNRVTSNTAPRASMGAGRERDLTEMPTDGTAPIRPAALDANHDHRGSRINFLVAADKHRIDDFDRFHSNPPGYSASGRCKRATC